MGFVVDKSLLDSDPHFKSGCVTCHQGNPAASDKTLAHTGMLKRPSDDPAACASCHGEISKTYKLSLHYTTGGMRGVTARFSDSETKTFNTKVFEQSCRSCHASCGDCHVKVPAVSGVNLGLIDGHKFVRKDEGKTCALCHGGRVYPEYTGEYGGMADVHYQRGMLCTDCHTGAQLHGDGNAYANRREVANRPTCIGCHDPTEGSEMAVGTHGEHGDGDWVSCQACHSAAAYRNCSSCHLGKGATATPAIHLGRNPRNPDQLTTLRLIPTVRNTFLSAGIKQEKFDALPNYWDAAPHNIRKRTDRTRDCDVCHVEKEYFLTEEKLIQGGSEANKKLIFELH